jgi:ATP-dependent DNA helicase RecQ
MAYGLQDVVNQRRMIDESSGGEEFKRVQRGKLDALLALAEASDCRRVRLLGYFGEPSSPCGNCDNCLVPPDTWDGTEAARKLLSCIYRMQQHSGIGYGAGHLIDVLRGKVTDKVRQHHHDRLSTFGVGADLDDARWRGVLRQLVALGHVVTQGDYNVLALTDSARSVLKGEVAIVLRLPREAPPRQRLRKVRDSGGKAALPSAAHLEPAAQQRFAALRAWRAEVAKEHNLPAYVVFHDATLAAMATEQPTSLDALGRISGVGAKKLDAYGRDILRVLGSAAA